MFNPNVLKCTVFSEYQATHKKPDLVVFNNKETNPQGFSFIMKKENTENNSVIQLVQWACEQRKTVKSQLNNRVQ